MTEELKQKAKDFIDRINKESAGMWLNNYYLSDLLVMFAKQAYLAGAEPREKQIADLEEKLANADYQLEGRDLEIKELKEQIEKLKCCGNCGNRTIGNCEYCKRKPNQIFADTLTSDYWKLRR